MLDFLGIGAQKAGTTWIYENLRNHPEIFFPYGKEIHFWDSHYGKGLEWYRNIFAAEIGRKQGEITPAYAFQPIDIIKQIRTMSPKLRLIYSVRNPIDRAWSSAKMAVYRAEMTLEEASDQWFIDHFYSQGSLKRGDYLSCIANWLQVFDKEQLLVVDYAMIASRPEVLLEKICRHIGVNPGFFTDRPENIQRQKIHKGIEGDIRPTLLPVLHEIYDGKIEQFKSFMQEFEYSTVEA